MIYCLKTYNHLINENLEISEINQAYDYLQELLEQILALQENSEESDEEADSPRPEHESEVLPPQSEA